MHRAGNAHLFCSQHHSLRLHLSCLQIALLLLLRYCCAGPELTHTVDGNAIFLPGLARAFQSVDTSGELSTLQFAKACDAILPVFDRLGKLRIHNCRLMDSASSPPSFSQQFYERRIAQQVAQNMCRCSLRFCKVRAHCKGILPTPSATTLQVKLLPLLKKTWCTR